MNSYKNLEIYQAAFNLAIKIYRLNVSLPVKALLHQGNKLRWTSLRIKDLIAEGFSGEKGNDEIIKTLKIIKNLNDEVLLLLKKIKSGNENKQIPELIKGYRQLGQKTESYILSFNNEKNGYIIPFQESILLELAATA